MIDNPAGGFLFTPVSETVFEFGVFKDGTGGIHGLDFEFLGHPGRGSGLSPNGVAAIKPEGDGQNDVIGMVLKERLVIAPV